MVTKMRLNSGQHIKIFEDGKLQQFNALIGSMNQGEPATK